MEKISTDSIILAQLIFISEGLTSGFTADYFGN